MSGLVAQADTAQSAFSAPAGMSRLAGTNMTLQGMVAISFADFEIDENETEVDGGSANKDDDPTIIPSLYFVRQWMTRTGDSPSAWMKCGPSGRESTTS